MQFYSARAILCYLQFITFKHRSTILFIYKMNRTQFFCTYVQNNTLQITEVRMALYAYG
jgi:hypothetical protein